MDDLENREINTIHNLYLEHLKAIFGLSLPQDHPKCHSDTLDTKLWRQKLTEQSRTAG